MLVSEFKHKVIQGLYNFDHFEHESGAFIQRSHSLPYYYIFQDANGKRYELRTFKQLKARVEWCYA